MMRVHRKTMFINILLWIGTAVFYFYIFPFISGLIFSTIGLDLDKWNMLRYALGAIALIIFIVLLRRKTENQNVIAFKLCKFSALIKFFIYIAAFSFIPLFIIGVRHTSIYFDSNSDIYHALHRFANKLRGAESFTFLGLLSNSFRYNPVQELLFSLIPYTILISLFEEIFFRAVIYNDLKKKLR